jgi:alpha-ribazole phosphatase
MGRCASQTLNTLTFIRHGQSIANGGAVTMPHDAIPLSAIGQQQATALAALLNVRPSTVLVSNMIRTHETAAPYCKRHCIVPQINANLDEFSVIDSAFIEGLTGTERKPFVNTYWDSPQPDKRLGENADTFAEFEARVSAFMAGMKDLPDATVIFGHGMWIALMIWRLLGYTAHDAESMNAFRRFQLGFPMPNCAIYTLAHVNGKHWSVQADADLAHRLAAVQKARDDMMKFRKSR